MQVSIITVCKNSASHLEGAMQSVFNQDYPDIQYIVIDGKSTDRTLEIIDSCQKKIDIVISESDSGIYNAMNKGLRYVDGMLVYFLNSDDRLYDDRVVSDVVTEFSKNQNRAIIYGNVAIKKNGQSQILKYGNLNKRYFYKNTICHQALFIQKDVYKNTVGGFDDKYPIHADVDWIMRAYLEHKVNFSYFDRNICNYSSEGFSSNPLYAEKYKYDRQEISAKYFLEAKIKLGIKRILIKLGLYS